MFQTTLAPPSLTFEGDYYKELTWYGNEAAARDGTFIKCLQVLCYFFNSTGSIFTIFLGYF